VCGHQRFEKLWENLRNSMMRVYTCFMNSRANRLRSLRKIRREIARTGETDRAIFEIERLLITRFAVDYADDSITLSDLRTRWEWDPLQNDPRFQKILASPEPKTLH
jgi:hypothetical protein